MNFKAMEIATAIKQLYQQILAGDVLELYNRKEQELNALYDSLQSMEIGDRDKANIQDLYDLNALLIGRIQDEKRILLHEKDVFEKQKIALEHYTNASSNYSSYFVDKKR